MIVKELIAKLQEFDPEMRVLVSGYEGGFDDPRELHKVATTTSSSDESWNGKYTDNFERSGTIEQIKSSYLVEDEDKLNAFFAIVIPRY